MKVYSHKGKKIEVGLQSAQSMYVHLTDKIGPKVRVLIFFLPSCHAEAILEKCSHTLGFLPEGLSRASGISARSA